MADKKLSVSELRSLIESGEAGDPLVFLESVMNGQDPRRVGRLYELVQEIENFTGGAPDPADWAELVAYVEDNHRYHYVGLQESTAAAKTLAEYLHPKRKQVDIIEGGRSGGAFEPLTADEVDIFRERFNAEF